MDSIINNTYNSNVVSPHCVRAYSENFPAISPDLNDISSSIDEIPGTDASLLALLDKKDNRASKKRRLLSNNDAPSSSGYNCGTDNNSNQNHDPNSEISCSHSQVIPETIQSDTDNYSFNDNWQSKSSRTMTSGNLTDLSNNQAKQVIIIEPGEPGLDVDNSNPSDIFSNDIQFSKALEASIFGRIKDLYVKKNHSKKMYILKFDKVDSELKYRMLITNKLGPWDIKCREPRSQQYSRGVIGPVSLENSEEELLSYLSQCNPNISNVKRLKKGITKTPTLSILIEFNMNTLPEYVNFGFQKFKVRTFVPSPWQCFNCQRFGHNASDCKAKPRCLFCAKDHKSVSCPLKASQSTIANDNLKCANCLGNHAANYGGCQRMKTAKIVEKVRAQNGLFYRDVLTNMNKINDKTMTTVNTQSLNIGVSGSGPQNPNLTQSGNQIYTPSNNPKILVNSCTQTDDNSTSENTDFVKTISVLLIKLLSCLDLAGGNSKMLEVFGIVKTIMNVDISDEFEDMQVRAASLKSGKQISGNTPFKTNDSSTSTYNSHPGNKKATGSPGRKKKQSLRNNRDKPLK